MRTDSNHPFDNKFSDIFVKLSTNQIADTNDFHRWRRRYYGRGAINPIVENIARIYRNRQKNKSKSESNWRKEKKLKYTKSASIIKLKGVIACEIQTMSQSTSGGYQSGNRPISRRFRKISRVSYRSHIINSWWLQLLAAFKQITWNWLVANYCQIIRKTKCALCGIEGALLRIKKHLVHHLRRDLT